jgi:hypothetical protein
MRHLSYNDRIVQFVSHLRTYHQETAIVHNITPLIEKIGSISEIWHSIARLYVQNLGLENGNLDGIKLFCTEYPTFQTSMPISYRTHNELSGDGLLNHYVFATDIKAFNTKEEMIDYIVGELIQDREFVIFSITLGALMEYDPFNFIPQRRLILRYKSIDWGVQTGRTNFNSIRIKKDFTPDKKIPTFKMN